MAKIRRRVWNYKPTHDRAMWLFHTALAGMAYPHEFNADQAAKFAGYLYDRKDMGGGHSPAHRARAAKKTGFRYARGENAEKYLQAFCNHQDFMREKVCDEIQWPLDSPWQPVVDFCSESINRYHQNLGLLLQVAYLKPLCFD